MMNLIPFALVLVAATGAYARSSHNTHGDVNTNIHHENVIPWHRNLASNVANESATLTIGVDPQWTGEDGREFVLQEFFVDQEGTFAITDIVSDQDFDAQIFLYEGTFDPTQDRNQGILLGSSEQSSACDDGADSFLCASIEGINLTPCTQYSLVTTVAFFFGLPFADSFTGGSFTTTITGPPGSHTTFGPLLLPTTGACGDPHFTTWGGETYDYHGKCDLELITDPTFSDGKGLRVQLRTEILRQWSYIKDLAIQIGDDVLEVHGSRDKPEYWINHEHMGDLTTFAGFHVSHKRANSKSYFYTIHLKSKKDWENVIEIRTFKDFVRINFDKPNKDLYRDSVGLLGNYTTGHKLGRDGKTVFTDNYNEFGQEWQVLPGENLFHTVEGPQAPHDKCILPSELHAEEKRRRLGESKVTKFEAEVACHVAGISDSDHDMCVADVLSADDLEMAGIYAGHDGNVAGSH